MTGRLSGAVRTLTATALVAGSTIAGLTLAAGAAGSSPLPHCGDDGTPAVVALHDPHFYIDSSSTAQLYSGYAGYAVRAGASARAHLYLGLSGFTGDDLTLAQHQPASVAVPDLASGGSAAEYFLLSATAPTTTPQTHTVTVYDGPPAVGVPLCTRTYTYSDVVDTIKALANKVNTVTAAPTASSGTIGDAVTVTVTGNTGVLGAGPGNDPGVLAYTPNVISSFPANAWRLERTELRISPDGVAPATTYADRLYLSGASGPARDYTARYVFRAIGPSASPAGVEPIQYIASGTQVKHTDQGSASLYSLPAVSPEAAVSVQKRVVSPDPAVLPSGGGTATYAVTLTNSGGTPQEADWLTDQMPADATFVSGSLKVDGRSVADPDVADRTITMVGPFDVPAYGSTVVTYSLALGSTAGARTNSAAAHYGQVVLDASADVTVSDPASATVTVLGTSGLNLGADLATTPANTPKTIDVLANDSAPSGLPLSVTAVGAATTGSAVLNSDGTITYNPLANRSGTASFSYTATDGYATDHATVTVTVDPATARDIYSTGKSTQLPAGTSVLANDACTSCTVSPTLVSGPLLNNQASGSVAMASNGTFTYTPVANATGTVTFTYRATDPATGHTADGNVVIYVMDIAPDFATTPNATAATIPVQANDPGCSSNCHPQAGTAPAHGTVTYSGGSATYTPTGTSWGLDSFTYGLTGNSGSTTGPVTVLVGPPTSSLTTTYGTAGQTSVPANGSCSGCTYAIAGPAGHGTVAVDAATGTATYEPAAGFAGTDSFTYVVRDPVSGLRVPGTVNVSVGPAAADDSARVLVGSTVTGDVGANDECSGGCTYTRLSAPSAGSLSFSADGTWSYTAGSGVGPVSFTYSVSSALAPSVTDTATVRITVLGARDDTASTPAGAPVTIDVLANDPCAGCTLTGVGPASSGAAAVDGGDVRFVPSDGFSGLATFTYTLTQGSATTTAQVTVTVDPVGVDDGVSAVLGHPVDVLPLANDVAANPALTGVGTPATGTATQAGDVVTFTPAETGPVSFAYQAVDALGTPFTATISVTVTAAPAVADDTAGTDSGTPAIIDVLHNDTCAGCEVTLDSDPADGTATVDVMNRVVYSAAPGFSGRDTFTYTATDPVTGGWASAQVTVTVRPVARDDDAATNVGQEASVDVLANDACTGCTLELGPVSDGGTAAVQDGKIAVTPDAGFSGTVTVTYTATDPVTGEQASAVLTLVVSDARPDSATVAAGQALAGLDVLANDTCDGCAVTAVTQPAAGEATFAGTGVSWTPPDGFAGLVEFGYTAGDGDGHFVSSTVRVLATPPARTVRTTVGQAVPIVAVPASDCGGCAFAIVDGTENGDLDSDGSGGFTYTPADGWTGTDGFRYRVTDPLSGQSAEATATVVVGAAPDAAPALAVTVTAPDPGSLPKAGDALRWTWHLHNTGNVPLTDPALTLDPDGDALCAAELPATLDVDATVDCTTTHVLTQAEIDAGTVTVGVHGAAGSSGGPVSDDRSSQVSLARVPSLALTGSAHLEGTGYSAVGDLIDVTYTITNDGNTTLTDLAVALDGGPDLTCEATVVAPGDDVACTGTHEITQADLDAGSWDSSGTADGTGGGQTVQDSDTTTTPLTAAPPADPQPSSTDPQPSSSDPQPSSSDPQPSSSDPQPSQTPSDTPSPSPSGSTTPPASGTGTVSGLVWFDRNQDGRPESGEWPLPGTTVQLTSGLTTYRRVSRPAAAVHEVATTGRHGEFRFTGLPAGHYEVHASITLAGFYRTFDSDGVVDWNVGVTVTPGSDAVARFAGLGKGTVAGTVFVQGSRAPVADAAVQCRWAGYDDQLGTADDVVLTTRAGADGRFAIARVPYGVFRCVGTDARTGARSTAARLSVRSATPVIAALPVADTRPSTDPVPTTNAGPPAATGVASASLLSAAALALVTGAGFLLAGRRRRTGRQH